MVGIPSVNPRGRSGPGEAHIAEFVAGWLRTNGIEARLDEVVPGRANVVAVVPGTHGGGPLLLETHLDTVEVDGMTVPAFGAEVRGGRLSGRGSCDAKAALAAFMLALAGLVRRGVRPRVDVVLAAVVDEEHGALGVRHLLRQGLGCQAAVVGEPTESRLVIAHKGCVRFRVRARGRTAHSAQPRQGDNAIERMARLISHVAEVLAPEAGLHTHPLLGPATLCTTMIEGGTGANVVPGRCTITLDRRLLPGEDPRAVWAGLERGIEDLEPGMIEVLEPDLADWALDTDAGAGIVRGLAAALRAEGLDPTPAGADFGSDANKIARQDVPAVVFGPGSIANAHQPDEWVELAQVESASRVIGRLCVGFPDGPPEMSRIWTAGTTPA